MNHVYAIMHLPSERVYVGSTTQTLPRRWGVHRFHLRHGSHPNAALQASWAADGEGSFLFCSLCQPDGDPRREEALRTAHYAAKDAGVFNEGELLPSGTWIKRHSRETRAKIGRAQLGGSRPTMHRAIESYDLKTGETVKRYPFIRAVSNDGFCQPNVCEAVNGNRKSAGGLGWRETEKGPEGP